MFSINVIYVHVLFGQISESLSVKEKDTDEKTNMLVTCMCSYTTSCKSLMAVEGSSNVYKTRLL